MELKSILMFLLTILLGVISAWSLGTFLRLKRASYNYKNNRVFETACQLSKPYVNVGVTLGVVITILSIFLIALSSLILYRNY